MATSRTFSSSSKGVAIVTGSAQGIGASIASRLADDGFDLVLNDIDNESKATSLHALQKDLEGKGRRVRTIVGDVSNEEDVKYLVNTTVKELGSLDVMVANAGIAVNKFLADTPVEEWDKSFAVNVRGTCLCYKYAAEQMIKQGRAFFSGACSIVGKKGIPEAACYCSTKFAIRGSTQSVAQEYGKYGITVDAYAPVSIETDLCMYSRCVSYFQAT